MLDWIGDLIEWVLGLIPRLVIIRSTHRMVKFVRGKKLVLVEPGLAFYWPLVTDMMLIAVSRQTLNLPTQRLVTKDGKRVIASAVIIYYISDAIEAVGKSWDYDETVRDVSMAAVASIVTQLHYDQLLGGISDELRTALTTECRAELKKFGVNVKKCVLTDFCPANVIALSNSDFVTQSVESDDDE